MKDERVLQELNNSKDKSFAELSENQVLKISKSRDLSEQKAYWSSMFEEEVPVLDMPADYPRPKEPDFLQAALAGEIPEDIAIKLKKLADRFNATEYMVLLSALMITLGKYTRQEDIVVAGLVSARAGEDTGNLIGKFINTLPMRGKPEGAKKYIDFLHEIKDTVLKAYENRDYPFEELLKAAGKKGDLSKTPLFDVMLVLQDNEDSNIKGIDTGELSAENTPSVFNLSFIIQPSGNVYSINLQYCTALFMKETAQRILIHYIEILKNILKNPEQKIDMLDVTTEEEREAILNKFNDTYAGYLVEKTVAELFEEQAEKTPDKIAVVYGEEKLTYRELNERANTLALKLRRIGVRPDDFVAIATERSLEMVVGIYGIIKSGGAYVPIDAQYPEGRIRYMLTDCKPKAAVTYRADIKAEGMPVIDLADSKMRERTSGNPVHVNKPDDLLYCIYTSGTTGNPKGVMIEHGSAVNFCDYNLKNHFQKDFIDNTKAVYSTNKLIFDITLQESHLPLLNGIPVVIAQQEIGEYIPVKDSPLKTGSGIGFITTPTKISNHMLDGSFSKNIKELSIIMVGAERFNYSLYANIRRLTDAVIYNGYGPTETTCGAVYYKCNDDYAEKMPIGKPIANTKIYILNGDGLCGIGMPGELCIAGAGLARGYLNRPELTEEKFKRNPFGEGRIYRSGDLARWLPDGNIEYLGRMDEQVKIRGFRIEPGEIKTVLGKIKGIKDCAVIVRKDKANDNAIYAYFVSDIGVEIKEIRNALGKELPEYMIPGYMMRIDSIPATVNGKLDTKALPDIEIRCLEEYEAPENEIETKICGVFAKILNAERVSACTSFYELGGDSIKAIRVVSKLRECGYNTNVSDILNSKTARNLAVLIEKSSDTCCEQGEVCGEFDFTPIMHFFKELRLDKPEHFNQSMMIKLHNADADAIKKVFSRIVEHHDVLRAVMREKCMYIRKANEGRLFDYYEYETVSHNAAQYINETGTGLQASFDLENGPLVKLALFNAGEEQHLLVIIHHLVVDGVSWRIILEDFAKGYSQYLNGENIKLPLKTSSYAEWAKRLKEYASGIRLSEELEYWMKVDEMVGKGAVKGRLNEASGYNKTGFYLDRDITYKILTEAKARYNAGINDILLAALGMAFKSVTGQKHIVIEMEGHGREAVIEDIAIDRTVGWFTSVYPVVLNVEDSIARTIAYTKEMFRNIPANGFGYNVLKYLNGTEFSTNIDIGFNYLGGFEEGAGDGIVFSEYPCGDEKSRDNKYGRPIAFEGLVKNESLCFVVSYDEGKYDTGFIENIIKKYIEELNNIADDSQNTACIKTASDFEFNGISVDEFDGMLASINGLMSEINGDLKDFYPLTYIQEGILFHNIMEKDNGAYFIQCIMGCTGQIDINILSDALELLTSRFDVLRTVFLYKNTKVPVQAVLKERKCELYELDISGIMDKEAEIDRIKAADLKRGFDLEKDSLIRVTAVNKGDGEYKLIWSIHHIIIDGWSNSIIFSTFFDYYNRLSSADSKEQIKEEITACASKEISFGEYVKWVRKRDINFAKDYFRRFLDDYDNVAAFNRSVYNDSGEKKYNTIGYKVSYGITEKIKRMANTQDVTLNTVVEAALGLVVQKYLGLDDVVFGKVVSGREVPIDNIDSMAGIFINTIPQRIKTSKDMMVRSLLKNVQQQSNESSRYDYLGLAEINALSNVSSDLIKILLVYENYYIKDTAEYGAEEQYKFNLEYFREQTNYDITISAYDKNENLYMEISYDECMYDDSYVLEILKRMELMLFKMADNTDRRVQDIELLFEEEKDTILNVFNNTYSDYPRKKTVVELFEEQVLENPGKVAVVYENSTLTYKELNERANNIANTLRKSGVKPDDFVAIIAERSLEMIVGIYGIIKSGAAYVPMDPAYPEDRLKYMLEDCKPKALLTYIREGSKEDHMPAVKAINNVKSGSNSIKVIDLDKKSGIWLHENENPERINKPNDLAYVIYTSGTTGKPKGVMIEHRSLVNLVMAYEKEYALTREDVLLQFASFSFDQSVWEIFGIIMLGGTLCMIRDKMYEEKEEFLRYLEDNRVSVAGFTPAFIAEFEPEDFKTLRVIESGGAELKKDVIGKWLGSMRAFNTYGPTENTVNATTYECTPDVSNVRIPIGKPASNVQVYMMDGMNLCGIGMMGELCIAGDGVARGYLNSPGLTDEKFINNPFGEGKLYRTGDLAKWLPDGNIDFMGRIDEQIKIRGFRIELGEIESVIRKSDDIRDCAVIAKKDSSGDMSIYAHIVSDKKLDIADVRAGLRKQLPSYMIPAYIAHIDSIPLTINGKVDKRKLGMLEIMDVKLYVEPGNDEEKVICEVYSSILNVKKVSTADTFFELGGDSIKAIRVVSKLREYGYNAKIRDILNNTSIAELAGRINKVTQAVCEQGEISGEVRNTPIMQYFDELKLSSPGYYNQAMMLEIGNVNKEAVRKAIDAVVLHHDMLRAVKTEGGMFIRKSDAGRLYDYYEYDISSIKEEDKQAYMVEKSNHAQGSINLYDGPLTKAVLFLDTGKAYLQFIIHHLVVDGVSFRIIIEDFKKAYILADEVKEIELPKKTVPYTEWSKQLRVYAKSEQIGKDKAYWDEVSEKIRNGRIEKQFDGKTEYDSYGIEWSREITGRLTREFIPQNNVSMNDVLVTALGMAINKITGQNSIAIEMEGHGRENIIDGMIIDRTVGWFTSIFPVVLDIDIDPVQNIERTKNTLNKIPNNGVSYNIIKYLLDSNYKDEVDLCFNYLGSFDEGGMDNSIVISEMNVGNTVSEDNICCRPIDINGLIENGRLKFYFRYDKGKYGSGFVSRIADMYKQILEEIISMEIDTVKLEDRIELPVVLQDEVKVFLHRSLPLCIILAYENYKGWYYSNYIQIFSQVNEIGNAHLNYMDPIDSFVEVAEVICLGYHMFRDNEDYIDFVRNKLSLGYYLIAHVDEMELSNKEAYKKDHYVHSSLIYGYDNNKKVFKGIGFDDSLMFSFLEYDYNEMQRAFVNGKKYYKMTAPWCEWSAVQLIKPKTPGKKFAFDKRKFLRDLHDYISSVADPYRLFSFGFVEDKTEYGINTYDVVLEHLKESQRTGAVTVDYLAIHLLHEHKQGLYNRVNYLIDLYGLNEEVRDANEQLREFIEQINKVRIKWFPVYYNENIDAATVGIVLKELAGDMANLKIKELPIITRLYKLLEAQLQGG